jgi:hypothetical protein
VDVGMRCVGVDRILAAGPLVKLSRIAGGQRLENYASVDVAVALADRLLLTCADVLRIPPPPSAVSASIGTAAGEPPRLGATTARKTILPGGLRFVYAAAPSIAGGPAVDLNRADPQKPRGRVFTKPPGGRIISTHSDEGFCKLAIDSQGTIVRCAFLGKNIDLSSDMLTCLMNLPAALLHQDLERAVETREVSPVCLLTHVLCLAVLWTVGECARQECCLEARALQCPLQSVG